MALQFSDTTNYNGLVQKYEREIGVGRTTVSGNTDLLKEFTVDCNLALDDYFNMAVEASGRWQLDDYNHTDYAIIYTNLVSGQQDYPFIKDANDNIIKDIYRVAILPSATATLYQEIYPVDAQSDNNVGYFVADNTATGVPAAYDKTANGIFLDSIPSYSVTNGLKIYVNREPSRLRS